MMEDSEHTLEFLLAFDGHVHHYPGGYFSKFEIRRITASAERPHGLRYSFTLHGPNGQRLIGFDNAHSVAALGSRFKDRPIEADHWHRSTDDPGRPYVFTSAAQLIDDFFDEIERVLSEHGIESIVIADEESRRNDRIQNPEPHGPKG